MNIYRVSFLNNEILSIKPAEKNIHFDGNVFLQQEKGRLIFAIVRAENEQEARSIVSDTVRMNDGSK